MLFLRVLSIILLTALTLNVFRFLIFDNNLNSFLKLSLVIVTLWTGARSCFSISMQEKLYLFDPNIQITLVWICLSLIKKSPFQLLGLSFHVILDWGSYIVLTSKTPSKKIGALVFPMKFFLLRSCFIYINQPFNLACNTFVMSGFFLLRLA